MADADSTSSENSDDKSEIKDMPPPCLPSKPLQKTKVLDEESKEKSPSKEKSEAVPQSKDKKDAQPELAYKIPSWSGIPDELYSLEVLKNGCIISNIDLTSKPYHVFGRLPSCDVSLEHPSVSRHHAVVQYKASESSKGDKGFYIYDLESTHGTTVNKSRLEAKRYYRLRVGYVFKFGGSSRLFILQGPEEPEDPESEPSAEGAVSSSSEVGRSEVGRVMSEEEYEEWKREREGGRLEEQDTGIDWGMGEDAVEEPANSGDLGQGDEDAEEHHFKDPKKTLRGFFEREGLELEYDVEEKGPGHARVYHCRVKLPIDGPSGDPLYAEAAVTGKKRESVLECAKEACRMLDAAGLLRQSTHESKKPKEKDWEENDYYDSDEDTFLDRTGSVEKKRLVRMKRAGKDEPTTETYESLMSKLEALNDEIKSHENKLQGDSKGQRGSDSNAADSLDDYMSSLGTSLDKSTISQIRRKLFELKKERQRLNKLVNIAKPAILPAISEPCPSEPGSENDEVLRNTQSKSVPSDSTITTTVDKDTNIRHEQLTSLKGETPMQVSVEELASPKESSDQNSKLPEQTSAEFVVPNVVKYNKRKHSIPRKICAKKAEVSEESKSPVLLMDEKQEQKTVGSGAATVDNEQDSDENSDVEVEVVEIPDKKKKRSYGAPSQWQAVNDPTYSAWTPPEGQTGDGKTHLNEKFGY